MPSGSADEAGVLRRMRELVGSGAVGASAAVEENLGGALRGAHRLDEAYRHLVKAFSLAAEAAEPAAMRRILRKQSAVLFEMGEYRLAAAKLEDGIAAAKRALESGVALAFDLDVCAQALLEAGDKQRAREMVEEAEGLLAAAHAPAADRAVNAAVKSRVLQDCGDAAGAAEAFALAHNFSFADARETVDVEHYRQGFAEGLKRSLPAGNPGLNLFIEGAQAQVRGDFPAAFRFWDEATKAASGSGDLLFAMRVQTNVVALFADLGAVDDALDQGKQVVQKSAELGLARPEYMVLSTLGSLANSGAEVGQGGSALGRLARAAVLMEMHEAMLPAFALSAWQRSLEFADSGALDAALAKAAEAAGNDALTESYYRSAVRKAREGGAVSELANRLCGLFRVLGHRGEEGERAKIAGELEGLLAGGKLSVRGRLVAHRTLGARVGASAQESMRHLGAASETMERYRASLPRTERRDFDRDFHDIPTRLAEALRQGGQVEAAFDALQLGKGRVLIETLAGGGGGGRDGPLTAAEARTLVAAAGAGTVLADFSVTGAGIVTYLVDGARVRTLVATGDLTAFSEVQFGDVEEREARLVELTVGSPVLRELAEAIAGAVPPGSGLMVVPDTILNNLPLHAIPVGGTTWAERMPTTYAPTAAVLRFRREEGVGALRAVVAGDSAGDLPGARAECAAVAKALGVSALLGAGCTPGGIAGRLAAGVPDILHLAVHGRADMRHGGRSSLLFAEGGGGTGWVDVRQLAELARGARLVVFSGCSTGVLGLRHGTQLVGAVQAALEAGAETVIASLWPVDDGVAKRFMEAFYAGFEEALAHGPVDLRGLVERARRSVAGVGLEAVPPQRRDGRHFVPEGAAPAKVMVSAAVREALLVAPFCLFGLPVFRHQGEAT